MAAAYTSITKVPSARRPLPCSQSYANTSRSFFPSEGIDLAARSSGAFQRIRNLTPLNFVTTFAFWKADSISLQSLAAEITTQTGRQVSAQAIAEKLAKPETEIMFQTLVRLALDRAARIDAALTTVTIPGVNKILVADSSQIALNDKLADELPGTGNTKPNASLKVHATFSLTDKQFVHISLSEGTMSDHSAKEDHRVLMKEGDLILRDLGYFDIDDLRVLGESGRYFVSRIPLSLTVFADEQGCKIDLWGELSQFSGYQIDRRLSIGSQAFQTRVVAVRLPKEDGKKRLAEAEKEKGRPLTPSERAQAKWNLYITNLAIEQASCATIRLLAAARWQVELIFKSLKSGLGIDRLKAASTASVVRNYVWGKLLGAALLLAARNIIEARAPRHLSFIRWIGRVADAFCDIRRLFVTKQFLALARLLERVALKHCLTEKHSKPRTEEKLNESIDLDKGRQMAPKA